jgi:hypothetical protein
MVSQTAEESLVEQIQREYREGASLWSLQNRYAQQFTKTQVRTLLEGSLRPKGRAKSVLDESEVVRLRDEIKAKWTPEQASRRWVGRYLSKAESLGEGLSRELRRMGGQG